jgi:hypothetical protein
MTIYLLFVLAAVLLVGAAVVLWRLWADYTRVSPEDEEHEREIASLNDAQANRLSDQQLTRPIDTDTGWAIMVRRGGGDQRRRPRRRR